MTHSYPRYLFSSFIKIKTSDVKNAGWYSTFLLLLQCQPYVKNELDFNLAHTAQIELLGKYYFSALCPFRISFVRFRFLLMFRMFGAIRS